MNEEAFFLAGMVVLAFCVFPILALAFVVSEWTGITLMITYSFLAVAWVLKLEFLLKDINT